MTDQRSDKKKYAFFVDGIRFEVDKSTISGKEMRALAQMDPDYGLFMHQPPDKPDRQIHIHTSIDLTEPGAQKYYTVVPTR